jgi:hypothetical protein
MHGQGEKGQARSPEGAACNDDGRLPHDEEVDPGHGQEGQRDEGGGVEHQRDQRHAQHHYQVVHLEVVRVLAQPPRGLQFTTK